MPSPVVQSADLYLRESVSVLDYWGVRQSVMFDVWHLPIGKILVSSCWWAKYGNLNVLGSLSARLRFLLAFTGVEALVRGMIVWSKWTPIDGNESPQRRSDLLW